MGEYTDNNYFYLPSLGADGADEKTLFDNALKATDAQIATNKSDISTIKTEIFSNSYDFATRLSELGSTEAELIINSNIAIDSDTTVPSNITLQIHKGGKFTVASGVTLTINGAIKAGMYQIFDGSGTVSGNPKIDAVYPEWFGAVGDGTTDDTEALQSANTFYKTWLEQTYYITTTINVYNDINGTGKVYSKNITALSVKNDFITIKGIEVYGDNSTPSSTIAGIYLNNVDNCQVLECKIHNFEGSGIKLVNCNNYNITDNLLYGNTWSSGIGEYSDILAYSTSISRHGIISRNRCFSNVSQSIYVNALTYDREIIISENIIDTLDSNFSPLTSTPDNNKRHGIMISYNTVTSDRHNIIVSNNIIKNVKWAGIYVPGGGSTSTTGGGIIISNNVIENASLEALTGSDEGFKAGINVYAFNAIIEGNVIQDCSYGRGIRIADDYSNYAVFNIVNNQIKNCGTSIDTSTYGSEWTSGIRIDDAQRVFCSGNVIEGTDTGIYFVSSSYDASKTILSFTNNYIYIAGDLGFYFDGHGKIDVINNKIVSSQNSIAGKGIYIRQEDNLVEQVKNNFVKNFEDGYYKEESFASINKQIILQDNIFDSCTTAYVLRSTSNSAGLCLFTGIFINVTNITDGDGYYACGRFGVWENQKAIIKDSLPYEAEDGYVVYYTTPSTYIGQVRVSGSWKSFGAIV